MKDNYRNGNQPDYSDALNRLGYAYCYMAANAYLVEKVFSTNASLSNYCDNIWRQKGKISICVFGAGPGTELLGIASWLRRRNLPSPLPVDFYMFDVVDGWKKSVEVVVSKVLSRAESAGIVVYGDCHRYYGSEFNIAAFQDFDRTSDHDIYIFSYVLSELSCNENVLHEFGKRLSDHAPEGARFIFLDRAGVGANKKLKLEAHVNKNICAIIDKVGLYPSVHRALPIVGDIDQSEWKVINEPKFADLIRRIDWYPRRKSSAFHLITSKALLF
jgi:hypothetical protein